MTRKTIELAARGYVCFFMTTYGLAKLIGGQFYRRGELPAELASTPLGEVPAFDLAWTFMGYSFAYMAFIGIAEIVGAALLLWERTKLIGVAVLLPVLINVLVFDVIFLDAYGALASATLYTLLLLVIVALNRETVVTAIARLTRPSGVERTPTSARLKTALAALAVMAVLFGLDQLLVNLLGHGRG